MSEYWRYFANGEDFFMAARARLRRHALGGSGAAVMDGYSIAV